MKVTIFGTGYVGLVTGACLADVGNHVLCVDIDEAKIQGLEAGRIPIYEPGLDEIVRRNHEAGRLDFTTDMDAAVAHGVFQFIAVGTPPDEDGSADLQHVLAVARTIGERMTDYRVVVDKSTVPVGTADLVRAEVEDALAGRQVEFDVVSNPEFLKEGAAIDDFMKPDRVVIGVRRQPVAELLTDLYQPYLRTDKPLLAMAPESAEMTKYVANALLSTKISFINEVANLCERCGSDINDVRRGIGHDSRIGFAFLLSLIHI